MFYNRETDYDSVHHYRDNYDYDSEHDEFYPEDWGGDSDVLSYRFPYYCYAMLHLDSDGKLELDGLYHAYRSLSSTEFNSYFPNMRELMNKMTKSG